MKWDVTVQTAGHVFTEIEFLLRERTQESYLRSMTLSLRLGDLAKNIYFHKYLTILNKFAFQSKHY